MDLVDQLKSISSRIEKQKTFIQTEEATKNAFVMPFINALGYDVFNPMEVVPEYTCDVGTKTNEKVDYAIIRNGKPVILIECKTCGRSLDDSQCSQLIRYFHTTDAKFAILTNGIVYRFYTDLEAPNRMDSKPYLELNLLDINNTAVQEIKRLTKSGYDLDRALSSASELKHTREIKAILSREVEEPSDVFIRFFVSQVYSGRVTKSVISTFGAVVKKAVSQFINEKLNERLESAINRDSEQTDNDDDKLRSGEDSRITTTEEELEGYYIVKSIVRQVVDPNRIDHRDAVGFFSILLDDNNRKPICKLHFNKEDKFIGLFDNNKIEERIHIKSLNDIFAYSSRLQATISLYDS